MKTRVASDGLVYSHHVLLALTSNLKALILRLLYPVISLPEVISSNSCTLTLNSFSAPSRRTLQIQFHPIPQAATRLIIHCKTPRPLHHSEFRLSPKTQRPWFSPTRTLPPIPPGLPPQLLQTKPPIQLPQPLSQLLSSTLHPTPLDCLPGNLEPPLIRLSAFLSCNLLATSKPYSPLSSKPSQPSLKFTQYPRNTD